VNITYEVELGGAQVMKELPFVVGVISDLSGQPKEGLPRLKDRKFVEIDRDNFNDVLASCAPRLALSVDNRLAKDDTKLNVELKFRSIEDFNPAEVVKQIEPLNKLFEARQRLMDLLAKLDGNDKLDALLQEIVDNPDNQKALKASTAAPAA